MGWGSAFVLLTRGDLRPGETVLRWLPAAASEPDHFMRIALAPAALAAALAPASGGADVSGLPAACTAQLWVSYR